MSQLKIDKNSSTLGTIIWSGEKKKKRKTTEKIQNGRNMKFMGGATHTPKISKSWGKEYVTNEQTMKAAVLHIHFIKAESTCTKHVL